MLSVKRLIFLKWLKNIRRSCRSHFVIWTTFNKMIVEVRTEISFSNEFAFNFIFEIEY